MQRGRRVLVYRIRHTGLQNVDAVCFIHSCSRYASHKDGGIPCLSNRRESSNAIPLDLSVGQADRVMSHASTGCGADVGERDRNSAAVQGILNLCGGLPIALAVTGCTVAARVSSSLEFEYVCDSFLNDMRKKANLGASVLKAAIHLSLKYLDSELEDMTDSFDVVPRFSMYEMYTSLCVLKKQQWVPVSVLAKMWAVDYRCAEHIGMMFSFMSLGKTSVQQNDAGVRAAGLQIHDLHNDFCQEQELSEKETWHFRLLKGHMPSISETKSKATVFGGRLDDSLSYRAQDWSSEDVMNRKYIFKNLSRHLLEARLVFELWSLILDPHWMHAQVHTGGISDLKRDFEVLSESVARNEAPGANDIEICKAVHSISRYLESSSAIIGGSVSALSFSVLSRIDGKPDSMLYKMGEKIKSSTPGPYMVPVTSLSPCECEALESAVNILSSHREALRCPVAYSSSGQ